MDTSSPRLVGTPAVHGNLGERLAACDQATVDPGSHAAMGPDMQYAPAGVPGNLHGVPGNVPGLTDALANQPPRSPAIATRNTTHHNAYPGATNRPPHLRML